MKKYSYSSNCSTPCGGTTITPSFSKGSIDERTVSVLHFLCNKKEAVFLKEKGKKIIAAGLFKIFLLLARWHGFVRKRGNKI